jgi:hypothetical protein
MSRADQLDLLGTSPSTAHITLLSRAARAAPPPPSVPIRTDRDDAITWLKELVFPELVQRALERVDREEAPGVTADDAVALCMARPQAALLGESQRAFSWVGPWLAKLARAGSLAEFQLAGQLVRRRSSRPSSHGNLQVVYLHPTDRRAAQGTR